LFGLCQYNHKEPEATCNDWCADNLQTTCITAVDNQADSTCVLSCVCGFSCVLGARGCPPLHGSHYERPIQYRASQVSFICLSSHFPSFNAVAAHQVLPRNPQ
jgi:hypothetical protein